MIRPCLFLRLQASLVPFPHCALPDTELDPGFSRLPESELFTQQTPSEAQVQKSPPGVDAQKTEQASWVGTCLESMSLPTYSVLYSMMQPSQSGTPGASQGWMGWQSSGQGGDICHIPAPVEPSGTHERSIFRGQRPQQQCFSDS